MDDDTDLEKRVDELKTKIAELEARAPRTSTINIASSTSLTALAGEVIR